MRSAREGALLLQARCPLACAGRQAGHKSLAHRHARGKDQKRKDANPAAASPSPCL